METAKLGDTIRWSLPKEGGCGDIWGKTYESEVAMVDEKEQEYGVYSEYGQDIIPFNECEIVKPPKMKESDKARELIDKFLCNHFEAGGIGMSEKQAKRCAEIACDEIIQEVYDSGESMARYQWWQKVRSTIKERT